MSNTHEFLSASAAGLTVHCAAAPSLQAQFPDDDSPAAIEGTAAHWVWAEVMEGGRMPAIGSLTPAGVAVTQEMIEGAQLACDAIKEQLGDGWSGAYVEQKIKGTDLHPTHNGGTPDAYYFDSRSPKRVVLRVWDYKFGHGFVDEYENWQLINYVSLILEAHDYRALINLDVEMTVIQPRCYTASGPVRSWRVAASDLVPYFNRLRVAYAKATEPNSVATPGPWCNNEYCTARHACQALQRSAYFAAEESYHGGAKQLSPDELGVELRILEEAKAVLDARIDGLKEQALSTMQAGKNIPHYVIGWTQPRMKWKVPDEEVIGYGLMMGLKLNKPPEAVTPFQAAKLGLSDEVLKGFAERPKGTPKLERDTKLQLRRVFTTNQGAQ